MTRRILNKKLDKEIETFRKQVCQILDVITYPQDYIQKIYTWRPPVDIYETDSAVIVKTEIAGVNRDDFKISFEDRVLIIRGTRKDTEAKLNYHCLEIPYGEFQIKILIRGSYIENKIKTKYENGYLYVMLTKSDGESHAKATRSILDKKNKKSGKE